METTLLGEIRRIQRLSVDELKIEWARRFDGEVCRSKNRSFLVKRLCWRVQELALGGLSDHARARLVELAPDVLARARAANVARDVPVPAPVEKGSRPVVDLRLPSPGTVLTRQYHGREIRVTTLDDGFEWDGRRHGSLSEVARAVTGQHWSGPLFFGLRKRSGRG